jgi:hypothetical protein
MHMQASEQNSRTKLSSFHASSFIARLPLAKMSARCEALKGHPRALLLALPLSEPCSAPAHNLPLTYQLRIKLAAVKRQVDVEIDTVEGTLWRVHPFEILF